MIVAWGAQVGLRPFADPISDAEIARVYQWSSDAELLRWSGGVPTDLSFREFAERMRHDQRQPNSERQAFFILTRAGELVGRIGCFAIDWRAREGELGIVIGEPNNWSRGYGRDAVTTLSHYLFETTPLERIFLLTFPDNQRAIKAFAACGFRTAGIVRKFMPDLGEFDGIEMEITRADFMAQHAWLPLRVEMESVMREA
ncbi:MAG: GNAT family N-acetyltransferase [Chloroflexi bacterium]|nr:GNAT family N-acetyltransferase [Chloroflexota bacterium]